MTKIKKFVIICSVIAAGFLIAFLSVFIIYSVRRNSGNEEWKKQNFYADCSVGELCINYLDFALGTIVLNDQRIAVTREKEEDQRRGHFCYEDANYYIIIAFNEGKPIGFLYLENGNKNIHIDKLVLV